MVKAYWIAVALAVGVAIGLYVGRAEPDVTEPGDSGAHPASSAPPPAAPAQTRTADAADGAVRFGVGFQKVEPGVPAPDRVEFNDPMHEEFLREQRDDSWAYLREAELENSMVMETGVGNFNQDRIECRASICVVELSAKGGQVETLKRWFDEKNTQRSFSFDEPLLLRGASFSGDSNRAEARLMYVNPRRLLPLPGN